MSYGVCVAIISKMNYHISEWDPRYLTVVFVQISHGRHLLTRRWGRVIKYLFIFEFWVLPLLFCVWCSILLYLTGIYKSLRYNGASLQLWHSTSSHPFHCHMTVCLDVWIFANIVQNEVVPVTLQTNMLAWVSYQIRKIAGCACAGNAGNVSPRRQFQRKPLVSDPGMHHGTCVTHVPWCMSGSLTCDDGENVPGIPGACAPAILRIWQEAHCMINEQFLKFANVTPLERWVSATYSTN